MLSLALYALLATSGHAAILSRRQTGAYMGDPTGQMQGMDSSQIQQGPYGATQGQDLTGQTAGVDDPAFALTLNLASTDGTAALEQVDPNTLDPEQSGQLLDEIDAQDISKASIPGQEASLQIAGSALLKNTADTPDYSNIVIEDSADPQEMQQIIESNQVVTEKIVGMGDDAAKLLDLTTSLLDIAKQVEEQGAGGGQIAAADGQNMIQKRFLSFLTMLPSVIRSVAPVAVNFVKDIVEAKDAVVDGWRSIKSAVTGKPIEQPAPVTTVTAQEPAAMIPPATPQQPQPQPQASPVSHPQQNQPFPQQQQQQQQFNQQQQGYNQPFNQQQQQQGYNQGFNQPGYNQGFGQQGYGQNYGQQNQGFGQQQGYNQGFSNFNQQQQQQKPTYSAQEPISTLPQEEPETPSFGRQASFPETRVRLNSAPQQQQFPSNPDPRAIANIKLDTGNTNPYAAQQGRFTNYRNFQPAMAQSGVRNRFGSSMESPFRKSR